MTTRNGGDTTGRTKRDMAVERHERAVHLLDGEAIRRVLSGSPSFLTLLEREAVFVLADTDGIDRETVAAGLGMTRGALADRIQTRRKQAARLTRDLWAAAMLRPAGDLVDAVRTDDPEAVAKVLLELDGQRLAVLCVVLAARVVDAEPAGAQ